MALRILPHRCDTPARAQATPWRRPGALLAGLALAWWSSLGLRAGNSEPLVPAMAMVNNSAVTLNYVLQRDPKDPALQLSILTGGQAAQPQTSGILKPGSTLEVDVPGRYRQTPFTFVVMLGDGKDFTTFSDIKHLNRCKVTGAADGTHTLKGLQGLADKAARIAPFQQLGFTLDNRTDPAYPTLSIQDDPGGTYGTFDACDALRVLSLVNHSRQDLYLVAVSPTPSNLAGLWSWVPGAGRPEKLEASSLNAAIPLRHEDSVDLLIPLVIDQRPFTGPFTCRLMVLDEEDTATLDPNTSHVSEFVLTAMAKGRSLSAYQRADGSRSRFPALDQVRCVMDKAV